MKIESYLIASTVNIAVGQRLVRKICANCKTSRKITPAELKSLNNMVPRDVLEKSDEFYYGQGCAVCGNTGYYGRVGVYEVLVPGEAIREAVLEKASASEIRKAAIESGMVTMIEDGFTKARRGITTIEEVLRMLYE
jgi:type II secretory ATPase GspE/PulE/Tfp pilus assembly ATPase PilB-like protein